MLFLHRKLAFSLIVCIAQTWKRRHFRIIGANMVAFNDVTKRAITTIDLRKAVSLHDDQEKNMRTPASHASSNSYDDEFDGPCGVERSFKLFFPGNQRISFFADTEADKAKWYAHSNLIYPNLLLKPNPLGLKFWGLLLVVSPLILSGQSFSGRSNKIWRNNNPRRWAKGVAQPHFSLQPVAHNHDRCFPTRLAHSSMLSMLSTCPPLLSPLPVMYK